MMHMLRPVCELTVVSLDRIVAPQTTNRPRNGGNWWSTSPVTGGQSELSSDLEEPRNPGILAEVSRAFTRQRPLVRTSMPKMVECPGQLPIAGGEGSDDTTDRRPDKNDHIRVRS